MTFLKQPAFMIAALAMAVVAWSSKPVVAQSDMEGQAAVVISLASIEEQLKDVNYLSDAAGFGRLGGMIINSQADEYLKGVDKTKPIGLFVYIDEENPEEPTIVGVVSVTDYDEVVDTLSQVGEVDDTGDIDVIAMDTGENLFISEQKDRAVFSNKKEAIAWAPADLEKALGDLPKKYNIAAQIYGQRIPQSLRDQAIDAMRDGYEQQLDESGIENDLQQKSVELQMKQMESLINETKVLMFGFTANKDKNSIYFDLEMVGLEGSQLAKQAAEQKNSPKTRFGGFMLDGALMNANGTSKFTKDDIDTYKGLMAGLKDQLMDEMSLEGANEKEAEAVEGLVESLFEVMSDTIEGGTSDGGLVVMGNESPSMAFGFHAVNASKLEKSFRQMAEIANDSGEMDVKLNAESIGNIKFHQATIPIPESEEEMQDLLGDSLDFYVGVDDKTVYLAAGDNSFELLKKCIDKSASSSSQKGQVEVNFYVGRILDLISSVEQEEMMAQMSEILKETGNDRISIMSDTIDGGVSARLEIQDGILRLISVAAEQLGGGFGGF